MICKTCSNGACIVTKKNDFSGLETLLNLYPYNVKILNTKVVRYKDFKIVSEVQYEKDGEVMTEKIILGVIN